MMSPSATLVVSDAVLLTVKSGVGASTVTDASSVTGPSDPWAGVALSVASFVIGAPESISPCVTT